MFWRITRDHLGLWDSRVGYGMGEISHPDNQIAFTLHDDDGIRYYSGVCDRAAYECDELPGGLYSALQWGMADSGCTDLRVNGESIYG